MIRFKFRRIVECENYIFRTRMGCPPLLVRKTKFSHSLVSVARNLGVTGMIRFLQQTETGCGDYTKERDKLLGNPDLEQLVAEIKRVNGIEKHNLYAGKVTRKNGDEIHPLQQTAGL